MLVKEKAVLNSNFFPGTGWLAAKVAPRNNRAARNTHNFFMMTPFIDKMI
jgi:hypothetical protein